MWIPPTIPPYLGLQYIRELERKQMEKARRNHQDVGTPDYSRYQLRPGFGRRLLWFVAAFVVTVAVLSMMTGGMASTLWW